MQCGQLVRARRQVQREEKAARRARRRRSGWPASSCEEEGGAGGLCEGRPARSRSCEEEDVRGRLRPLVGVTREVPACCVRRRCARGSGPVLRAACLGEGWLGVSGAWYEIALLLEPGGGACSFL